MKSGVALLIGGLVIGGVVYVAANKKKEEKTSTPIIPSASTSPSIPGLPEYVSQSLVDAYTKCYSQGCSFEEYKQVQRALAALAEQHPELSETWNYFMQELQKKSPLSSPQLTPPVKMTYQDDVDQCFYYTCKLSDVQDLTNQLETEYMKYAIDQPSVSASIMSVINELKNYYGIPLDPGQFFQPRSTSGRSTGACCASCAIGGPCEGCGSDDDEEEPEERGVG